MDAALHLEALASSYRSALAGVETAARAAHAGIDDDLAGLVDLTGRAAAAAPVFAEQPAAEAPAFVAPAFEAPFSEPFPADSSAADFAFDDAPLWQS